MKVYFNVFAIAFSIFLCVSSCQPDKEKENLQTVSPQNQIEDSAFLAINQKIRGDINNPELYFERSLLYMEKNDFESAMADIDKSLLLDSLSPKYHIAKAELIFRKGEGDIRKAMQVMQDALKKDIKDKSEIYLKLSEYYLFLRENKESIKMADEALKINMYLDKAYFFKGINFLELGDTAKAISSFQTAVEVNPENYDAYVQLGILNFKRNPVLAEQYFKNALDIKPGSIEVMYNLGLLYQDNLKLNEALRMYQQLSEMYPKFRESYFNMGYIHMENLNMYKEAIKYFTMAIKADSTYYAAYYNRGRCYELLGDVINAEKDFRKALQIKPDYDLAAMGLSRILEGNEKYR